MFYDEAFRRIFENSSFSETATITVTASDGTSEEYEVAGFFFSGMYGETSPAQAYAPKRTVRRDSFEFAAGSLGLADPRKALQGALVTIGDRGVFRVLEARGAQSGVVSLALNPKEV